MDFENTQRIDEIEEKYFTQIIVVEKAVGLLFWFIAALSLLMPYLTTVNGMPCDGFFKVLFLMLVLIQFALCQISRFWLVPKGHIMRRRQLLSDAFGTPLIHERTSLYYNNNFPASISRLGANVMESAFFSKEIITDMLLKKRIMVAIYMVLWILSFLLSKGPNLEMMIWITQVVFSGQVISSWLTLEILRFRYERTFEQLNDHFRHNLGEETPAAISSILDAFVSYETAKSAAGILLWSKSFKRIGEKLKITWEQIRADLKMDSIK